MKSVKLGKVAKIDRTVATYYECQTLPYIGLEHIEKDTGNFSADFVGTPETLLATKFKFTSEHVLYGKLRPYLNKVALPSFDGVCTTEILPILPFEDRLDRTYLWVLMLTPKFVSWASRIVSGANLPRLSPSDLSEFELPLPSLLEQKRLAAILAKADRLRRLRRYGLAVSDTYLQTVFLEMFGNPILNPKGFPLTQFEEICDTRLGKMLDARRQTGQHRRPYLRNTDVQWSKINTHNLPEMDFDEEDRKILRLKKGDVLICEGGEVGRSAIWKGELTECYFQKALHRARPKPEISTSEFIMWLMRVLAEFGGLEDFTSQATIAHLTGVKLKTIEFPLPPLALQQKFAQIVQKHERLRAQQREAARQAEGLFQALLHRAFRGELSEAAVV